MINRILKFTSGDTSILVLATLIAQGANVLAYPILTRIYTPGDFGVFSAIIAISTFMGAISLLRLDTIFQIAPQEEEKKILSASFIVTLSSALVIFVAVFFLGPELFSKFQTGDAQLAWHWSYAVMITVIAAFLGLFSLAQQRTAKIRRYKKLAFAQVSRTFITVIVQIIVVLLLPSSAGLVFGFLAGLVIGTVIIWCIPAEVFQNFLTDPKQEIQTTHSIIVEYWSFIPVDVANVLISTSVIVAYPLFVIFVFGSESAGFFVIASQFAFIPVSILSLAISTVYFQRFSRSLRDGIGAKKLFISTLSLAIFIALVSIAVLGLAAKPLIQFLFSSEWSPSSTYILYLLPTVLARVVIGCIGSTPLALRKPKMLMYWNIVQILVLFVALVLSWGDRLELFLLYSGFGLIICGTVYAVILFNTVSKNQL